MRGRVGAAWSMALPGCEPATSPLVGWIGGTVDPREGFGTAGLALLIAAAAGWRPLTRTRRTDRRHHHPVLVPAAVHHPI
jgi:hypothetical protein